MRPLKSSAAVLPLLRRFLCNLLLYNFLLCCFLGHVNPPFQMPGLRGAGWLERLPECRRPRVVGLSLGGESSNCDRNSQHVWERIYRPPTSENYRFFAAFFTAFFATFFFAISFLLRYLVSASTDRLSRHNWWAESFTLIPDVDYG